MEREIPPFFILRASFIEQRNLNRKKEKIMQKITEADLRCMKGQEGLVLWGCGGDLQEWVVFSF